MAERPLTGSMSLKMRSKSAASRKIPTSVINEEEKIGDSAREGSELQQEIVETSPLLIIEDEEEIEGPSLESADTIGDLGFGESPQELSEDQGFVGSPQEVAEGKEFEGPSRNARGVQEFEGPSRNARGVQEFEGLSHAIGDFKDQEQSTQGIRETQKFDRATSSTAGGIKGLNRPSSRAVDRIHGLDIPVGGVQEFEQPISQGTEIVQELDSPSSRTGSEIQGFYRHSSPATGELQGIERPSFEIVSGVEEYDGSSSHVTEGIEGFDRATSKIQELDQVSFQETGSVQGFYRPLSKTVGRIQEIDRPLSQATIGVQEFDRPKSSEVGEIQEFDEPSSKSFSEIREFRRQSPQTAEEILRFERPSSQATGKVFGVDRPLIEGSGEGFDRPSSQVAEGILGVDRPSSQQTEENQEFYRSSPKATGGIQGIDQPSSLVTGEIQELRSSSRATEGIQDLDTISLRNPEGLQEFDRQSFQAVEGYQEFERPHSQVTGEVREFDRSSSRSSGRKKEFYGTLTRGEQNFGGPPQESEVQEIKESHEGVTEEIQGSKDTEEIQGSKDTEDIQGTKDTEDIQGTKDTEDIQGTKDTEDIQGTKDTEDIQGTKESSQGSVNVPEIDLSQEAKKQSIQNFEVSSPGNSREAKSDEIQSIEIAESGDHTFLGSEQIRSSEQLVQDTHQVDITVTRPETEVAEEGLQIEIKEVSPQIEFIRCRPEGASGSMAELPSSRQGTSSVAFGPRPVTSGKRLGPAGDERPMTRGSLVPGGADRPSTRSLSHSGMMSMDRPDTRQLSSYGDRSLTRQGDGTSRPTTATRPTTSGRVLTARPGSAALRGVPGTATRLLSTATMNRPGTRTGVATGIGFNTPINVVDRPITQQGLSGMKTGSRGPQRQVQDKSYFMGLLRTKITELGSEIGRLSGDIDAMKQEQSTFLTYDKRVKEMAQELTELQGSLGDYNLLLDLINTDTERLEIDEETKALKDTNQEAAEKLDSLFTRKQDMETMMRQLEAEIEEERHMGESLVEAMKPELRHKYLDLRNVNTSLLQHLDQMQHNLDALDNRKATLEDEISLSKVKQEAVDLYEKLQDLEEKRAEIISENQKRGTPKEERERLLLQVKEDNGEIATMERQISEVQEQIKGIQEEIHHLDQDLEENQSERSQKYRELRKREETMDQFLATFEENKKEELSRLDGLENSNVDLLEKLSRNMAHFAHLPSTKEFDIMRGDLAFKEGELEKSRYTEQGLKHESINLQSNLQKIEALETKVQKEMVELKEKLARMEVEMVEFGDLDGLKTRSEEKRRNLVKEKDELEARKGSIKQNLQEVTNAVNSLKSQLNENETYTQLNNMEKKWAHLEQTNFTLQEFIAQKRAESNFLPLKNQAMKLVIDYNKTLQEVVQSGGSIM